MPHVYLSPWQWHTDVPGSSWWRAPGGNALGVLDLRSLPQMSLQGGTPQGFGLFTYVVPPTVDFVDLGSDPLARMGVAQRDALADRLEIPRDRLPDASLAEILSHTVMAGRLRTSRRAGMDLYLGGFGSIAHDDHSPVIPAFQATLDVRWADYRRQKAAGASLEVLQRWTGYDSLKLFGRLPTAADLDKLVPTEHRQDGARPPSTTLTDNFNRADGELGANWTDDNGDADILTNMWDVTTSEAVSRYSGTSLSGDDHYSKAAIINTPGNWTGPMARKVASGTLTYYAALKQTGAGGPVQLFKRVAGSYTQLGANITDSFVSGEVYEVRCDGSSIEFWKNGSQVAVRTDTAITGNLQAGLVSNDTGMAIDDFEAADLGAPPAGFVHSQGVIIS